MQSFTIIELLTFITIQRELYCRLLYDSRNRNWWRHCWRISFDLAMRLSKLHNYVHKHRPGISFWCSKQVLSSLFSLSSKREMEGWINYHSECIKTLKGNIHYIYISLTNLLSWFQISSWVFSPSYSKFLSTAHLLSGKPAFPPRHRVMLYNCFYSMTCRDRMENSVLNYYLLFVL